MPAPGKKMIVIIIGTGSNQTGEPLAGASVNVAKPNKALVIDAKGEFTLTASKLDERVVKGYYSTTHSLNNGDVTTVAGAIRRSDCMCSD
jgi:hypothetical protein